MGQISVNKVQCKSGISYVTADIVAVAKTITLCTVQILSYQQFWFPHQNIQSIVNLQRNVLITDERDYSNKITKVSCSQIMKWTTSKCRYLNMHIYIHTHTEREGGGNFL